MAVRRRRPALVLAGVLVLAGCGDAAEEPTEPAEPVEPADADPADVADDADDADDADPGDGPTDADLAVASTGLGEILVDGDGMTLYLFTEDPPGESVCEDACLEAWPPLVVDDEPVVGDGVDEALVDTITRDDGDTQVTYDQAPLYLWAADQAPGDVTGQGVQDVWFVVDPSGAAITDGGDADDPDDTTDAEDAADDGGDGADEEDDAVGRDY